MIDDREQLIKKDVSKYVWEKVTAETVLVKHWAAHTIDEKI